MKTIKLNLSSDKKKHLCNLKKKKFNFINSLDKKIDRSNIFDDPLKDRKHIIYNYRDCGLYTQQTQRIM